jgi:hypothetical protein
VSRTVFCRRQQRKAIDMASCLTPLVVGQDLEQLPPILSRDRKVATEIEDNEWLRSRSHHLSDDFLRNYRLAETYLIGHQKAAVPTI